MPGAGALREHRGEMTAILAGGVNVVGGITGEAGRRRGPGRRLRVDLGARGDALRGCETHRAVADPEAHEDGLFALARAARARPDDGGDPSEREVTVTARDLRKAP